MTRGASTMRAQAEANGAEQRGTPSAGTCRARTTRVATAKGSEGQSKRTRPPTRHDGEAEETSEKVAKPKQIPRDPSHPGVVRGSCRNKLQPPRDPSHPGVVWGSGRC